MINFSEQLVKIVNMSDFNFRSKYPAYIPRNTYQQFVKSNSTVRSGFRSFSDCFWVDRAVLKGFCFLGLSLLSLSLLLFCLWCLLEFVGVAPQTETLPMNLRLSNKKCLVCHSPLADKVWFLILILPMNTDSFVICLGLRGQGSP